MVSCRNLSPLRIVMSLTWVVSLCAEMKLMLCVFRAAEEELSFLEANPASLKLLEIQTSDKKEGKNVCGKALIGLWRQDAEPRSRGRTVLPRAVRSPAPEVKQILLNWI